MTTTNLKPGCADCHALHAGCTIEEIFNLTKIDRWFLVQIKEIVDFEEELAGAKN
jgi:carbamoyl-phosphate synthase large subunit